MKSEFVHFHNACFTLRQMLIAVECLQTRIEENLDLNASCQDRLTIDLHLKIIELGELIVDSMGMFIRLTCDDASDNHSWQLFFNVESAIEEMFSAFIEVAKTAEKVGQKLLKDNDTMERSARLIVEVKALRNKVSAFSTGDMNICPFDALINLRRAGIQMDT